MTHRKPCGDITPLLERLRAGDETACDELIVRTCERLRRLARRLLRGNPRVRRWADTDDVLQEAAVRLCRSLLDVRPDDPAGYFGLAALQVRRTLVDLARHYYGPLGEGTHRAGDEEAASQTEHRPVYDRADPDSDPSSLAEWAELHELAGRLPDAEREVFDLLYYQGLSQADAAKVLGVSVRTVKRRWRDARLRLHEAMDGH